MPARWGELRTWAAAVDPGHTRLHLASVATAAMLLAAVAASVLRALTGQPITIVLFSVVLAMISNLAVNENDLRRRRVTTALMVVPAAASATVSALLSTNRVAADVVFVLVMMVAVAVRRYGPRGVALGMAAFMPFFFVQFLHAGPGELPFLLAGVVIGIGSTFLLRCLVFTRRSETVLDALFRAFEARLHALLLTAVEAVGTTAGEPDLDPLVRAQARLNETALLVTDRLDDTDDDTDDGPDVAAGPVAGLRQWIIDSELAAERVAMSVRRSVEHHDPIPDDDRAELAEGLRALAAATAVGTPGAIAARLYDGARSAVADIVDRPAGVGPAAREQRIGFAVVRLADAMQTTVEQARLRIAEHHDTDRETAGGDPAPGPVPEQVPPPAGRDRFGGLALHTRQAVQVGVATSLAIVVGELISPARWYWAVIAAFVVFAGTASRGDVLSRGWARAVGTAGGVVAGMLLALLVGGNVVASLALLFVCVFLALYLVRISQAMMAFWITAVLALLYGVIGQFSVQTLVLRVEETVVGGALGMLAAYLVLPTRSRTAFAEALDDALTAVDVSLRTSVDAALGRPGAGDPLEKARAVDTAVATVRTRAVPLQHPVARRPLRRGVHHTVRVVGAVDHYTRQLAAQAATASVPGWAATLGPAAERVRADLDGLRRILDDAWGPADRREHPSGAGPADYGVGSAEELLDAAEADAASRTAAGPGTERTRRLTAARLLRRIDQLAVGLARELCGQTWSEPSPAARGAGHADGSGAAAAG
ncbi:fusaric acid resistance family protein [Pseudonocardia alni]|uniref:Fusaric acid resistance family protein n=1 Tax=Pseudonocardia alni TaxID=33907 RepID=A0AA44ZMV6_PSEA5|nr:fusaric acid resistance family protein [Pseudonocardia alni]